MASRIPTPAQRKFAAGIVAGQTQPAAFKAAHPQSRAKTPSLRTQAKLSLKSKTVRGEIERLLQDPILAPVVLERCPEANDPERLREHAVSVMLRLTRYPDGQIAMHAALWIKDYADKLEMEVKSRADGGREKLLRDLRGLYSKALNAPLVETVAEPVEDGAAEGDSQGEIADSDPNA